MKKTILTFLLFSVSSLIADTTQDILTNSLETMGSLKTYKIEATSENLLIYDKKIRSKYTNKFSMLVDRPYKATIKIIGDTKNRAYYFNKGSYTLYNQEDVIYWGDLVVPKETDKALDFILNKYGEEQPVSILLYSDMMNRVQPNSITDFGIVMKNEKECNYIGFRSKDNKKDIHVWISTKSNLVVAYSIIRKSALNEYRINIDIKWTLDPKVNDKDFIFANKIKGQKIPINIKKTRK